MSEAGLDAIRRSAPLLNYLRQRGWKPTRDTGREEVAGLCPLHEETHASFYVNRRKNVFYCHGCGRGGDLARLIELLDGIRFREAVAAITQPASGASLLEEAVSFYQEQLGRFPEGFKYLKRRGIEAPEVIADMRIGYAPGACLRAHLSARGFTRGEAFASGLLDPCGRDRFWHCLTFPLPEAGSLYGRSIGDTGAAHRFLPRSKGGLYGWSQARHSSRVILVEGVLDVAALRQAGFGGAAAILGIHPGALQRSQLCDGARRTVYLCLDADEAGQQAAQTEPVFARRWRGCHARPPPGRTRSGELVRCRRHRRRFPALSGGGPAMSCRLVYRPDAPATISPFRVVDNQRGEIEWANRFLDMQHVRGLQPLSLRAYGHTLLHFVRWWSQQPGVDVTRFAAEQFTESTLVDYVRYQLAQRPKPGPETINNRSTMLRRLFQFFFQHEMPHSPYRLQRNYWRRSPLGYGRPRAAQADLHLKVPPRVIVPLSAEQVARFWASFRTARDLAIVALMLLNGLRSREVLAVQLEDLLLAESLVRVRGKGRRMRMLPLPPETIGVLQCYLRSERPLTNSPQVFVSLKGRARGCAMTPAGLRSLFRHHRATTAVAPANPHRFRHTFASDMIRAGVSLPALMRLMGHAHIQTTMLYIQITPQDVFAEYARAVARRTAPAQPVQP